MACVAATASATAATCFVQKSLSVRKAATASRVQGLPALRVSRVVCSAERKEEKSLIPQAAAAATAASAFIAAHPALAVVDERLGGEGTGKILGLSNPTLGWILVGMSALVWTFYFVYSSQLPEGDDDSGLSL